MAGVGALLMLLAGAFGAGFLLQDGQSAEIDFYGLALPAFTARSLVVLGIITGLTFALGVEALRWGVSRWLRRRRADKKTVEALSTREPCQVPVDDTPTEQLANTIEPVARAPRPRPRDHDRLAEEVDALRRYENTLATTSGELSAPSPRRRRQLPELSTD